MWNWLTDDMLYLGSDYTLVNLGYAAFSMTVDIISAINNVLSKVWNRIKVSVEFIANAVFGLITTSFTFLLRSQFGSMLYTMSAI